MSTEHKTGNKKQNKTKTWRAALTVIEGVNHRACSGTGGWLVYASLSLKMEVNWRKDDMFTDAIQLSRRKPEGKVLYLSLVPEQAEDNCWAPKKWFCKHKNNVLKRNQMHRIIWLVQAVKNCVLNNFHVCYHQYVYAMMFARGFRLHGSQATGDQQKPNSCCFSCDSNHNVSTKQWQWVFNCF